MCQHVVEALTKCHEENPYAKYLGACNDHKSALDQCFKMEKNAKRDKNLARARKFDERFKAKQAAKAADESPAPST